MRTTRAVRRASTALITIVTALAVGLGVDGAASADSLGVDVSSWQHTQPLNWSRVKADHTRFAFIKATEGTGYVNPYFHRDWTSTHQVGLYRGAYHFAEPRHGNARAQARFFVRVAGRMHHRGDLPPVLDLETTGGLRPRALQHWTRTWLRTVRHSTGRRPIVYTSPVFWRTALGNTREFAGYPLWIAHYGVRRPQVPGGWRTWTFWQGRRNGRVAGIGGGVDRNAFHGSMRRLRRLAHAMPRAPRHRTHLGLHTAESAVLHGHEVKLYGHLTTAAGRALPGRHVAILRRPVGGRHWTRIATVRSVAPTGWYQTYVRPRRHVAYRAVFRGGSHLRRTESGRVRVRSLDVVSRLSAVALPVG